VASLGRGEGPGEEQVDEKRDGETKDPIGRIREALEKDPGNPRLHAELGSRLRAAGDSEAAKRHLTLATATDPTFVEAHLDLGNLFLRQCDLVRALACFGMVQVYQPRDWLRLKMAIALPPMVESREQIAILRGRVARALTALGQAGLKISNPPADGGTLFYLAYHGNNDRPLYDALADLYLKSDPALASVAPHCKQPRRRDQEPRIKVGFISTFFFDHSIGRLNRGLIAKLDRGIFHVTVALVPYRSDRMTLSIAESADRVIILPRNLEKARRGIAAETLDVVVYPEIGMDSFTYCLAFARLAPVQCVSWGHPVTTGNPNLDYFVSAEAMESEEADQHYRETLYRLKTLPTYYYQPEIGEKPKSRADFGLDEGRRYYLIAQYLFKLHPDFDAILAAILRADPQGRLLVVSGVEKSWNRFLMARFQKNMPDVTERIQFIPRQPQKDFLALLACVDVSLDIPQFNGGNTTYEALSVGTPVVTMPTDLMRGRLCAAIQKQIGIAECIAETPDDYVALALRLAMDKTFGDEVRGKILDRNGALFEDAKVVGEWQRFFLEACGAKGIHAPSNLETG
jgi:predicted O-linked N-acetylglucosamine transferase (SPINDLY family)